VNSFKIIFTLSLVYFICLLTKSNSGHTCITGKFCNFSERHEHFHHSVIFNCVSCLMAFYGGNNNEVNYICNIFGYSHIHQNCFLHISHYMSSILFTDNFASWILNLLNLFVSKILVVIEMTTTEGQLLCKNVYKSFPHNKYWNLYIILCLDFLTFWNFLVYSYIYNGFLFKLMNILLINK